MMKWKGQVVLIFYHKLVGYLFYCIVLSPPKASQNGKYRLGGGGRGGGGGGLPSPLDSSTKFSPQLHFV